MLHLDSQEMSTKNPISTHSAPVPSVPLALITILRTQFLRLLLLDHAVSHRIETILT